MSSPTSRFDHDGDGADRCHLVDGETNGDGEDTNTFTMTRRTY